MKPKYKYYAVIGRIPDAENSCCLYRARSAKEAKGMFDRDMFKWAYGKNEWKAMLASSMKETGSNYGCYIEYVLSSEAEIEIE